jgi:hypothetical protein
VLQDRFIDRLTYLLGELDELENTNKDLFKTKLIEIYILLRCTESPIKEFKKRIEILSSYYTQRGIIENPSMLFNDKDRLSAFLIKNMEDKEKLFIALGIDENRNQDPT